MLVGNDVYISNVKFNNNDAAFVDSTCEQIGIYYNDSLNFPFIYDSCLIISNGNIGCADSMQILPDPYDITCFLPQEFNTMTCPELEQIVDSIINPAVLEFDFSINAVGIGFEYIFASDNYCYYDLMQSANDCFAFFLTDLVTQTTTNIALIPYTNLPVTIYNINSQINSQYYHQLEYQYFDHFQYNGYLSPFVAFADIVPHQMYHIKICIATGFQQDEYFDMYSSAVFLKCNTFASEGNLRTVLSFEHQQVPVAVGGCNTAYLDFNLMSQNMRAILTINVSYGYVQQGIGNISYDPPLPPQVIIPDGNTTARLVVRPIYNQNIDDTLDLVVTYSYPDGSLIRQEHDTIKILPSIQTILTDGVCQGELYQENGFEVSTTNAGTYLDNRTDTTQYSCDSITRLILTAYPIDTTRILDTICFGESYQESGFNIVHPEIGREADTLYRQSAHGCDSTVTLDLVVTPVYELDTFVAICPGESFTGLGFNVNESGIYVHDETSAFGCDSVVILTLDVAPISIYAVTIMGNNSVCSTDGGYISIEDTDFRRPYKIYCNGELVTMVLGSGERMIFGPYFQTGVYTVKCEVSEECFEFMLGEVNIYCIPTPPARVIQGN